MDVRANMGEAIRFSEFDKGSNTFKVHSHLVQPEDVGTYIIRLEAKFFSDTYEEKFDG